jgi:hypothetical protein
MVKYMEGHDMRGTPDQTCRQLTALMSNRVGGLKNAVDVKI